MTLLSNFNEMRSRALVAFEWISEVVDATIFNMGESVCSTGASAGSGEELSSSIAILWSRM